MFAGIKKAPYICNREFELDFRRKFEVQLFVFIHFASFFLSRKHPINNDLPGACIKQRCLTNCSFYRRLFLRNHPCQSWAIIFLKQKKVGCFLLHQIVKGE